MLGRNDLVHQLKQKAGFSLLAGALVWAILLAAKAAKMHDVTSNGTTQNVVFGPLVLTHITKEITDLGTVKATFSAGDGLVWYGIFWLLIGIACGLAVFALVYKQPHRKHQKDSP